MCTDIKTNPGRIINVQHFSVDDGPGIRTTIFLKGCPLKCAWCHNPESQNPNRELLFYANKCVGCKSCAVVCPRGVHVFENDAHTIDRNKCLACGNCAKSCYYDALEVAGQNISIDELMTEILADRVFYNRSCGGVTVSGGEPLAQTDFTVALLSACKNEGIHTCVETCGFGKAEDLIKIAEYTDLFLYDYKLTNEEDHKHYTGASNTRILANLDLLSRLEKKIILRCPMIPNVNMDFSHYDKIIEIAEKYSVIQEIHLEPYHPMGLEKSSSLGTTPKYDKAEFLEKETLTDVQRYMQQKTTAKVKIL